MVAANNNGGSNGGEALEEMNCHLNARGANAMLVVNEVAGDNNKGFI
jgi:hypothetical protein